MRALFLTLLFLSMVHLCQADELKLLSGKTLEGKIVEQTDKYVKFDEGEGISLTYYSEEIDSVNGKPMVPPKKPVDITPPQVQPLPAPVTMPVAVPVVENKPVPASVPPIVDNQPIPTPIPAPVATPLRPQINSGALLLGMGFFFIIWVLIYVLFCAPLFMLAKKFNVDSPWMAWVPLVNIYLTCKLAGRPGWWFLLCLVPFVNLIIFVILWMDISDKCGKPRWLGILMIVPFVNIFLTWYLALSKETQVVKI